METPLTRAAFLVTFAVACSGPYGAEEGSVEDGSVAIPDEAVAFRVTYARLLDPHVFTDPVLIGCTDVTDDAPIGADSANEDLNAQLSEDADRDTYFDLGVVVAMTEDEVYLADARCRVDDDSCILDTDAPAVTAPREEPNDQRCFSPDGMAVSSQGYRPAVPPIESPCSRAAFERLPFRIGSTDFAMRSATVAMTTDDPPRGLIVGFVDVAEAQAASVKRKTLENYLPGGSGNCADHDDRDEGPDGSEGWWFFLELETEPVRLVDAPPFVLSGGGCSVTGL